MTAFQIATLVIQSANTLAAVVAATGIWWGIRAMVRANDIRAAQHREAMDRQREDMDRQREDMDRRREADERRHAEAMAALNELIRAGQRQGEALARQGEALERQGAALDELLRRGAPESARRSPAADRAA